MQLIKYTNTISSRKCDTCEYKEIFGSDPPCKDCDIHIAPPWERNYTEFKPKKVGVYVNNKIR